MFAVFISVHAKHKNPLKAAAGNMILGTLSLMLAARIIGVPVNLYTMFTALTLGMPGTVLAAIGTLFL